MRRSRGRRYDPYDDDLRYYDPYYSRRGYGWQRPQRDYYYRQPAAGSVCGTPASSSPVVVSERR
jgi:hypothetical protein